MESARYESLLDQDARPAVCTANQRRILRFGALLLGFMATVTMVLVGVSFESNLGEVMPDQSKFIAPLPVHPQVGLIPSSRDTLKLKAADIVAPSSANNLLPPLSAAKADKHSADDSSASVAQFSENAKGKANGARLRVLFIRHAQSEANASGQVQGQVNFALSRKGSEQAEALRKRLDSEGIAPTHVYSSPLKRAQQTAEIASMNWNKTVNTWGDLIEQNVGIFGGKTWDEIVKTYPDLGAHCRKNRDWDQVPGAEKMHERVERAHRLVERVIEEHENGDVVVLFTHRAILQYIISEMLGTTRSWGFTIRNTAIFEFEINKDEWRSSRVAGTNGGESNQANNVSHFQIRRFNDATHLPEEHN